MSHILFAKKRGMTEGYLGDNRMAVTKLELYDTQVVKEKSIDKDGYAATVVSFGKNKRKANKAEVGYHKGNTVKIFVREVAPSENSEVAVGMLVHVSATSKGKGTAGVMKRWNFAGGPRTHGQSDRARAPGSIGQGTTPGRVLKGRHMAGRMGNETVTVRNLPIVAYDATNKTLWVAGPVPGHNGALVKVTVTNETTKLEELKYLKGYEAKVVAATTEEVQG